MRNSVGAMIEEVGAAISPYDFVHRGLEHMHPETYPDPDPDPDPNPDLGLDPNLHPLPHPNPHTDPRLPHFY